MFAKVLEAVNWTDGDIVVCFSGGKDSALILDLYCEAVQMMGKQHIPIKVAWANTTNETTAMRKYVPWFIKRCEDKYGVKIELHEVLPDKGANIVSVIKNEGLPFVSKMVAGLLRKVSKDLLAKGVSYDDIKHLHCPTEQCRDELRSMNLSDTTVLALTGWSNKQGAFGREFVLPHQWMPLLDISNKMGRQIRFTEKCCDILKKKPISKLNFPNIMTGEQALESKNRAAQWYKTGCNHRLPDNSVKSKPLGSVSPDAVLYALKYRNIPICSDYGEIIFCNTSQCYKCTKAQRTGCALCGFGIKFDPERFVRLQQTDPAKVNFAFTPLAQGGAGYREVCEYMNEYCKTNIVIPSL